MLIPCRSQWNTPILPVAKAEGKGWRMVQDFRAVNDATETTALPVPDPYLALQNLTQSHKYFTVIDLANAFFCLPLTPSSQPLFAFTYRGRQYTYTRLPQGFRDSPGLFNAALRTDLQDIRLPDDVLLIQYVDDLLLAAPSAETQLRGTHTHHQSAKHYSQSWKTCHCATHAGFSWPDWIQQESCPQLRQPHSAPERYDIFCRKQEPHRHPHMDDGS